MDKKPQEAMPGLFGFDVPIDGSNSSSVRKKQHFWSDPLYNNPMVRAYGEYLKDVRLRCMDCNHLYVKRLSKNYYKCAYRGNTGGPGTDHRVRWAACAKFEVIQEEMSHIIY